MSKPEPAWTVGELAQRSGVAVSALHYYESRGLISAQRSAGNQRRYARSTLRRVAFIRAAQRLGIGLVEITEALALLQKDAVFEKLLRTIGASEQASRGRKKGEKRKKN